MAKRLNNRERAARKERAIAAANAERDKLIANAEKRLPKDKRALLARQKDDGGRSQ